MQVLSPVLYDAFSALYLFPSKILILEEMFIIQILPLITYNNRYVRNMWINSRVDDFADKIEKEYCQFVTLDKKVDSKFMTACCTQDGDNHAGRDPVNLSPYA